MTSTQTVDNVEKLEAFPTLQQVETEPESSPNTSNAREPGRAAPSTAPRDGSSAAQQSDQQRARSSSLLNSFMSSNPPLGFFQAAGEATSKIPTIPEIRNGAFGSDGWTGEGQLESKGYKPHEVVQKAEESRARSASVRSRRRSTSLKATIVGGAKEGTASKVYAVPEEGALSDAPSFEVDTAHSGDVRKQTAVSRPLSPPSSQPSDPMADTKALSAITAAEMVHTQSTGPDSTGQYPNGYRFPRKHTWSQSIVIALKGLWKFFLTPVGFFIIIYALNVVGWGAMLFFTLIPPAVPALCHPGGCNGSYSKRRIWVEIDSQILNALFCVTGFGLLPWRLRDFYYLMKWRVFKKQAAHRRLAGIYRGWYRLPGSDQLPVDIVPPQAENKKTKLIDDEKDTPLYTEQDLAKLIANPAIPLPPSSLAPSPLTGVRAPPTKSWNLDLLIWFYFSNSVFQIVLATYMWMFDRFERPSWATGLFVTLGCLTGAFGGIVAFKEGKKVKRVEGIPVKAWDVVESEEDYQARKRKEDVKSAKKQSKHHQSRKAVAEHSEIDEVVVLDMEKHTERDQSGRH